jgi:hypothetical protein
LDFQLILERKSFETQDWRGHVRLASSTSVVAARLPKDSVHAIWSFKKKADRNTFTLALCGETTNCIAWSSTPEIHGCTNLWEYLASSGAAKYNELMAVDTNGYQHRYCLSVGNSGGKLLISSMERIHSPWLYTTGALWPFQAAQPAGLGCTQVLTRLLDAIQIT